MAGKARLPERLVLAAAAETVARFHEAWRTERKHLQLSRALIKTIEGMSRRFRLPGSSIRLFDAAQ